MAQKGQKFGYEHVKKRGALMVARYEKIVNTAEKVIDEFVKEWERSPYLWETEADVHGELYKRIKSAIHKKNVHKYDDMARKEYFERVYCKYKTYISGWGQNPYYPDIIIFV